MTSEICSLLYTHLPVCQTRWLALLQTESSDIQQLLCSHE